MYIIHINSYHYVILCIYNSYLNFSKQPSFWVVFAADHASVLPTQMMGVVTLCAFHQIWNKTIVDGDAVYSTHTMAYCGGLVLTICVWDNMEMPFGQDGEMMKPQGCKGAQCGTVLYYTVLPKMDPKACYHYFRRIGYISIGRLLYRLYRR